VVSGGEEISVWKLRKKTRWCCSYCERGGNTLRSKERGESRPWKEGFSSSREELSPSSLGGGGKLAWCGGGGKHIHRKGDPALVTLKRGNIMGEGC